MRPALLALAMAATALHADSLATLKETLKRLPGTSPIKGTLDIKTSTQGGKGKERVSTQGAGSVWVEDGPQGLRLICSRAQVQQLAEEALQAEQQPGAKSTLAGALGEARPDHALRQVNAAGPLALLLERARLLEERPETWNGRPSRLLTLEVAPKPLGEEERKRVSKLERRLLVWLGDGGLPLASRETLVAKVSALMMNIEQRSETSVSYTQVGDRLVATWREKKDHSTVPLAGDVNVQTTITFRVQ